MPELPRRWLIFRILRALGAALLCCLGGCVAGSLATQTGARPDETWSTAPRQAAHVGETVPLSFVLKKPLEDESINALGLADYCVFTVDGEAHDVDLDENGAFQTDCTLDRQRSGDVVKIVASAYLQHDARDHMLINDEWLRNESENNAPDAQVASAAVTLEIYQCQVELFVPAIPDGLDVGTARLVLHRRDGNDAVIYPVRPPRPGFRMAEQSGGGWRVTYQPSADQVNPTGTTPAAFSVFDHAGNRHTFTTELDTP